MNIGEQQADVGEKIRFNTFNPNHTATITGTITAIAEYPVARLISDIPNYHAAVLSADPGKSIPSIETMRYFILQEEGSHKLTAYSPDWVKAGALVAETSSNERIQLFNVTTDETAQIMTFIFQSGIAAKVIA